MLTTWIEAAASGRHGGPIRAGMWGASVIGTHPADRDGVEARVELLVDELPIGPLPAYWLEDRGVNALWHAPIPPQPIGARLRYRPLARRRDGTEAAEGPWRETIVRPNLPDRTEPNEPTTIGLVGNRRMSARIDDRGSTYDVFFPSVGLHSDVRPAEGDLPHSRSHFRGIVGGLALGARLDWFCERINWNARQRYRAGSNVLETELTWRRGPVRVVAVDLVAVGPDLPTTGGQVESPGQYLKRFTIHNDGPTPLPATFGLHVQAEVNGGLGDASLGWQDSDAALMAANRGHGHTNRKLARDATVEFAVALDGRGPVDCEPTGPSEAILLRRLELPAGGSVAVDVIVSGAFTGWRGDLGTFEHWLRPALSWFRSADLEAVEASVDAHWRGFADRLPSVETARPHYGEALRRSALAAALHCDAEHGAVVSGYDRGLSAYCWPRDAVWVGGAMERLGHPEIGRAALDWLGRVKGGSATYRAWFMKYSIDGWPEWETPAIDQTALIPWAVERHLKRTGDVEAVRSLWPLVERAGAVCLRGDGHPGLRWLEDLSLFRSAGLWETRYGAYFYSNACVVAGLRAAARLAERLDPPEAEALIAGWQERADRIWDLGILGEDEGPDGPPGLVDERTGRFLEGRRIGTRIGLWSDRPELLIERSQALDVGALAAVVPLELLPAGDDRARRTAAAILVQNVNPADPVGLTRWSADPDRPEDAAVAPSEPHRDRPSCLATLWMARYLLQLGRETGEPRHWSQAVDLLDRLLDRLGPLGLSILPGPQPIAADGASRNTRGAWDLHAMLAEAVLDLAGLGYNALGRSLTLRPVLPPGWPRIGLVQHLGCGRVGFRLERPIGGRAHRLTIRGHLAYAVTLEVELTCPGLAALGPWGGRSAAAATPRYAAGRLSFRLALPPGELDLEWTWGQESAEWTSAV